MVNIGSGKSQNGAAGNDDILIVNNSLKSPPTMVLHTEEDDNYQLASATQTIGSTQSRRGQHKSLVNL